MQINKIKELNLFKGLDDKEIEAALKYFEAKEVKYKKGDVVNKIAKPLNFFGVVLDGIIQVRMNDFDGEEILMASVSNGSVFGDSLCFLEKGTDITISAFTDANILKLKTNNLKKAAKTELELKLKNNFVSSLAQRTLDMNDRIQILSRGSLRDRLMIFFSLQGKIGEEFTVPFNRDDMATFLGVNRTALSRELGRMKKEGLIEFRKNNFRLL